eukprot:scaffold4973_cov135-Cylindrotheca_fusiformis.AAC.36
MGFNGSQNGGEKSNNNVFDNSLAGAHKKSKGRPLSNWQLHLSLFRYPTCFHQNNSLSESSKQQYGKYPTSARQVPPDPRNGSGARTSAIPTVQLSQLDFPSCVESSPS